jgi:hypothetical protein
MSPQFASLLHFPVRVVRQSLPSVAVVLGLLSLCNSAFAATRTNSLFVSATVVAGCQVSPASAEPAAGGSSTLPALFAAPVSVSCSLPVAYQVNVSSNSEMSHGIELAGLSSTAPAVAGLPGYTDRDLESLRAQGHIVDQPSQATGEPAYSLVGSSSTLPASPESAVESPNRNPDASTAGSITVTIVY